MREKDRSRDGAHAAAHSHGSARTKKNIGQGGRIKRQGQAGTFWYVPIQRGENKKETSNESGVINEENKWNEKPSFSLPFLALSQE
ncbi:hypothetical protein KSB_30180 [Ktedonobacter robiniae]|uniref:Uncharacterized protein n=1 Tax=Ktedonobacter robiniae TaxID=2778365 RepID=A0ABQ3UPD3_9CHLR|nr:hypothetical protein KSB_30180 [Ktedonobacter robiniae]